MTDEDYNAPLTVGAFNERMTALEQHLDQRYASKLTEKLVFGFVVLILVAFAGVIIASAIPKTTAVPRPVATR